MIIDQLAQLADNPDVNVDENMQTQGFFGDLIQSGVEAVEKETGVELPDIGGGSGRSGSSGSSGSMQTGSQGLADASACTPQSVAAEIAVGMRNPQTGKRTQQGKAEGLPQCDPATLRQGVQTYRQTQGGGGGVGTQTGPSAPPAPASSPNRTGSQPAPSSQFAGGLPALPDEAKSNLPASFETLLPDDWIGYVGAFGKMLVSRLGQDGANQALSTLAGILGRRIHPDPLPEAMIDELADDILTETMQKVVRLWQSGADEPYGLGKEGQVLWFFLQVATSSYDLKTGTHCRCIRE